MTSGAAREAIAHRVDPLAQGRILLQVGDELIDSGIERRPCVMVASAEIVEIGNQPVGDLLGHFAIDAARHPPAAPLLDDCEDLILVHGDVGAHRRQHVIEQLPMGTVAAAGRRAGSPAPSRVRSRAAGGRSVICIIRCSFWSLKERNRNAAMTISRSLTTSALRRSASQTPRRRLMPRLRRRAATSFGSRKCRSMKLPSPAPIRSLLLGMTAVCGIGRPKGRRNKAVTANQSARPPTRAASVPARNRSIQKPRQPRSDRGRSKPRPSPPGGPLRTSGGGADCGVDPSWRRSQRYWPRRFSSGEPQHGQAIGRLTSSTTIFLSRAAPTRPPQ